MAEQSINGQVVKAIYGCSSEKDWILMETKDFMLELRLGGINPTNEERSKNTK